MSDATRDPRPWVEALRQRGTADAGHLRFLTALAERTARQHGALRARLLERIAAEIERCSAAAQAAVQAAAQTDTPPPEAPPKQQPSPLGQLLADLRTAGNNATELSTRSAHSARDELPPLKAIERFAADWSRLSADRQLEDALRQAPENAGPLNAQALVIKALRDMQDIAPAYLQRFLAYTDALTWLEQAAALPAAAPAAAKSAAPKKTKARKAPPAA